jgi:predicted TPR repeat methyltransferase
MNGSYAQNNGMLKSSGDPNTVTVQSYNEKFHQYLAAPTNRGSQSVQYWIDQTLQLLSRTSRMLEIGSGSGVDANYIEAKGFQIERTDAALALVLNLRRQGHQARELNIVTDNIEPGYDLIFSSAVLQHLSDTQMNLAVAKIHTALNAHGVMALSVARGYGERWTNRRLGSPRYFQYWQPHSLEVLLAKAGFTTVYKDDDQDWLRWTVRKS